jgi:hypothetical protein
MGNIVNVDQGSMAKRRIACSCSCIFRIIDDVMFGLCTTLKKVISLSMSISACMSIRIDQTRPETCSTCLSPV